MYNAQCGSSKSHASLSWKYCMDEPPVCLWSENESMQITKAFWSKLFVQSAWTHGSPLDTIGIAYCLLGGEKMWKASLGHWILCAGTTIEKILSSLVQIQPDSSYLYSNCRSPCLIDKYNTSIYVWRCLCSQVATACTHTHIELGNCAVSHKQSTTLNLWYPVKLHSWATYLAPHMSSSSKAGCLLRVPCLVSLSIYMSKKPDFICFLIMNEVWPLSRRIFKISALFSTHMHMQTVD